MVNYDNIAEEYCQRRADQSRFDYNRDIEVPALIKLIGPAKDKTLLDLGCGFGDHARVLSRQKYAELHGIDISKKLVSLANKLNLPRTEFVCADMSEKLQFKSEFFDIVYSGLAIHYISNVKKLFKEVHRVLKARGIFAFSTGHPIFNLLAQGSEGVIGWKKQKGKKYHLFGNYFDESKKTANLGHLVQVKVHNYTFETILKTSISSGFKIIDYVDALPVAQSQKKNPEKYRLTRTLPTFSIYKLQKE